MGMASFQSINYLTKHNHFDRLHELNRGKKLSKRSFSTISCQRICTENGKKKKLRILIAGGGIAGLVLALAAKNRGFEVRVFEKDLSAVRGEGKHCGPIQLLSSALAVLEAIDKDVAMQIMEAGCVTGNKNNGLADGHTGEWFSKLDFLTPALEKGLPITQLICRIELQRLLLNAVGDELVSNNSKVVNFVNDANKVTVFLQNGEQYEGDILVGADGIWSMVRSNLFGDQKPKYSNFTCYSGLTDSDPKYTDYTIGYKIFLGLNQYFVALDIGKGKMQWYAFVREAPDGHDPSSKVVKKRLVEQFKNWCSDVVTLICRTPEEMILLRPIYDRDMITSWGKGRVVLLGDAAHPILPNLGHGGSMAIEIRE